MPTRARQCAVLLALCFVLLVFTSCRAPTPARPLIPPGPPPPAASDALLLIPRPKSVRLTGTRLRLTRDTRLILAPGAGPLDRMAALSVQAELHGRLGLPPLPIRRISHSVKGVGDGAAWIMFGEPGRVPAVARLLRAAGAAPCPRAEGYCLVAGPRAVVVAGHDPRGTFYGAQTLCQMLDRDAQGVYTPRGRVDDYPSLPWRGAHLFVGHHALPFHQKLIARIFARLKMNNLVLQCEQARWDALGKAPPPWAMSKSDLKADIAFARRYGMAVTPLVNSVGHMPWLFRDPANLPLAEDPQTPYAANVGNPETYRRLFRLYDEVEDTFHSDALHVGGDEVTQRGRFPCRSLAQYPTVADALIAHVTRLHDHLKARGVRTMLWSDMLLSPGDALDATNAPTPAQAARMRAGLSRDIILVDWHYSADDPFTSPRLLRRSGFGPVIGGTWATPGNIIGFSRALASRGQAGLLQTTWAGYDSSEANLNHERHQFAAFVLAADCAWNGGQMDARRLPYDPAKVFDRLYRPTKAYRE